MLASMEAVWLRRIFNSSLSLCLFLLPLRGWLHHLIPQKKRKEKERERENVYSIFGIFLNN
jgi:hypothetical protein